MAFKSEIHVAELASIRTGHTEGDIYYILDNGMLGDLPCKPGTFVKWHNDDWQIQPNEHYALASAVDGEIAQAIDNLLDDGSTSEAVVVAVPSSQSNDYIVGNYYEVQGKVAKLRTKTDGDNVTQLTFDTASGLLEAINNSGKLAVFTGTYNPNTSPVDYSGLPDQADVLAAIDAGKDVVLFLKPASTAPYFPWRLSQAFEYGNVFVKYEVPTSTDDGLEYNILNLNYAGPGNPWTWSKASSTVGKFAAFTYRNNSHPALSSIQAARDSGKAVFLVCGEDISTGLNDVTLEKGTVLTLVFDTGRPGYSSHSMEFMCTGMFGGSGCKTVKAVVNGDDTWSWSTFDHDKIFIASYGTTGIADIIAARVAGKFVVLKLNADGGFAQLYFWYGSPQMAQFIDASSGAVFENREDVWSTSYRTPIGAVGWGGALTDAASITVPNNCLSTLSTSQSTLTLNVNVASGEVPNFAVEITPSVDVTLTVTKTVGNTATTLSPSVSGGNSLTTGKMYQVTCVGSCWTLAEFTVPTP